MGKLLIWLEKKQVFKAVIDKDTIRIYDQNDSLVLKRQGLNSNCINSIICNIKKYGMHKNLKLDRIREWL